jgi:hypothetical protein
MIANITEFIAEKNSKSKKHLINLINNEKKTDKNNAVVDEMLEKNKKLNEVKDE